MRAYELMIIVDVDAEEKGVDQATDRVASFVAGLGGRIANEDRWGRRRFAYEINHKLEGIYTVLEFVAPGGDFAPLERTLRLADEVVRHKLIRLPEKEAARRGLFGEPTSAAEESQPEPYQTGSDQVGSGQIGFGQPSGQAPFNSPPAVEADGNADPDAIGDTAGDTGAPGIPGQASGQPETVQV